MPAKAQAQTEAQTQAEAPELSAAMHPADDGLVELAKKAGKEAAEAIEKACQTEDPGTCKEAEKKTEETAEKTGEAIEEGDQKTHRGCAAKPGEDELRQCAV